MDVNPLEKVVMGYSERNRDEESTPHSPRLIFFYIISPALIMMCIFVIETYILPLILFHPHIFLNKTKLDILVGVFWIAFVAYKLRRQLSKYWFFSWWPVLTVMCLLLVYAAGAWLGLPVGREEAFPGVVVMLSAIASLLFISLVSLTYYIAVAFAAALRRKK
ncbi:MAG: hypothetical protein AB1641_07550 [Thermodesulfobacteriota bacterium]